MALTEIQLPASKETFYAKLNYAANQMNKCMDNWSDLADFIANVTTADLTAMSIPTGGQLQTDLGEFRVMINEMIDYYNGDTISRTNTPNDVVNKIRSM